MKKLRHCYPMYSGHNFIQMNLQQILSKGKELPVTHLLIDAVVVDAVVVMNFVIDLS